LLFRKLEKSAKVQIITNKAIFGKIFELPIFPAKRIAFLGVSFG
jgi:hypothetical protein